MFARWCYHLAQMEPKITNHSNKIVVQLSLSLFATLLDRLLLLTEIKNGVALLAEQERLHIT